jgi:hypothetical protein
MLKLILGAVAALALVGSSPALACPDCHDCPQHKDKVAAADKTEKKDTADKCACGKSDAECKCGQGCTCAHCAAKKKAAEKKDTKKT